MLDVESSSTSLRCVCVWLLLAFAISAKITSLVQIYFDSGTLTGTAWPLCSTLMMKRECLKAESLTLKIQYTAHYSLW